MDTHEGDYESPLSLHKYLYANADPVNRMDPTGQASLLSQVGVVTIAVTIAQIGWSFVKPVRDRSGDVGGDYAGQPGEWESMVPFWGSGRAAVDEFQHGEYVTGSIDLVFAATDVSMAKGVVVGVTKQGSRLIVKSAIAGLVILKNSIRTWPKHHIFPQLYRSYFRTKVGINIDKFTMKIPKEHHGFLHAQGDEFNPGGIWNRAWADFIRKHPDGATADQVMKYAAKLITEYGLSGYAIVPYR